RGRGIHSARSRGGAWPAGGASMPALGRRAPNSAAAGCCTLPVWRTFPPGKPLDGDRHQDRPPAWGARPGGHIVPLGLIVTSPQEGAYSPRAARWLQVGRFSLTLRPVFSATYSATFSAKFWAPAPIPDRRMHFPEVVERTSLVATRDLHSKSILGTMG